MTFFSHHSARRPAAPGDTLRGLAVCTRGAGAFLAICAAAFALLATAAGEARAAWQEVGSRNFAIIGGAISIPVTRNDPIKALRLVNRGALVSIVGVRVIYRDRSTFTETRRFVLAPGERTRVFAARGAGKPVSSVVITLDGAALPSGQGHIVVLGDVEPARVRAPAIAAAPPPPPARPSLPSAAMAPQATPARPLNGASAEAQRRQAEAAARARVEAEARAREQAEAQARSRQRVQQRSIELGQARRPDSNISGGTWTPAPSGGSGTGNTRGLSLPPSGRSAPPSGGSSPPVIAAPAPAKPALAERLESAPPANAARSADTPVASAEAPREPTAASAREAEWDVVPVYYGTDRSKEADAKRVQYGSDRGKRLQLGRALVTVPKIHQVPNVERPWALTIPYLNITLYQEKEDPKRHFTMKELQEFDRAAFLAMVKARLSTSAVYKDHALVFVHGFNNSFDNAVYRTAQIAYDLKFDGAPFHYSWPSKGALGATDYSYDRESAGQAEPYFRQFMELVVKESGAKHVSVIAHSMGNQLLLATLRSLKPSLPEGVRLDQIILAAPDVDRDSFEFLAREIMGISRGVTLLAAGNDRALEVSRRFWGGVPRAGDVPIGGPVIVQGIDTIDITATSTALFALNHSGFAEKTALLEDIQQLIQTGLRPPNIRVPSLESVMTDKGSYWRYPPQ